MDRRPEDDGVDTGHDSVGMVEGAVVVLAEPGVFEDMGLGKRISVEEEEMAERLLGFEDEVCGFKWGCGDSESEGHVDSRRIDGAFIPILLW